MSDSSDPMDCSPPGSSVHGISQARILKWVALSFSRYLPNSGIKSMISYITGRFFAFEPPVDLLKQLSPTFLAPRISFMEDSFSTDGGWEDGFRMIQVHFIYCALYSYCYYISSISDYQALDTRGGGSLPYSTTQISIRIYETHWIFLRKSKKVLAFWPSNVTELEKTGGYRFHGHGQNPMKWI